MIELLQGFLGGGGWTSSKIAEIMEVSVTKIRMVGNTLTIDNIIWANSRTGSSGVACTVRGRDEPS